MKRKLIEYKIEYPALVKDVKLLWKKFLKKDLHWHFALEGAYFELRIWGTSFELEEYLNKKGWKFTKRIYKNNTPITRKYQACFDDVYHGYAMLAVSLPKFDFNSPTNPVTRERDSYKVMERIIHLAFNNFTGLGLGGERDALWLILADRTYMAGYNQSHAFIGYKKEDFKKEVK